MPKLAVGRIPKYEIFEPKLFYLWWAKVLFIVVVEQGPDLRCLRWGYLEGGDILDLKKCW